VILPSLLLLLGASPAAGAQSVSDYRDCVLAAAAARDDGHSAAARIVDIAEAACRREDLAMQAEWQGRIAEDLGADLPAAPGPGDGPSAAAARATRETVRRLALAQIGALRQRRSAD
jgi:hypothetical protein